MTEIEDNLTTRISDLIHDAQTYIESNSDWIYYFLNPIAGGNEELFKCMKTYPDEWEDYISFNIIYISGSFITIEINIDDGSEQGIAFKRYIYLPTFSETVDRNKKIYEGKLNEIKINNIKEDIEYLKKRLKEKEDELKILESK